METAHCWRENALFLWPCSSSQPVNVMKPEGDSTQHQPNPGRYLFLLPCTWSPIFPCSTGTSEFSHPQIPQIADIQSPGSSSQSSCWPLTLTRSQALRWDVWGRSWQEVYWNLTGSWPKSSGADSKSSAVTLLMVACICTRMCVQMTLSESWIPQTNILVTIVDTNLPHKIDGSSWFIMVYHGLSSFATFNGHHLGDFLQCWDKAKELLCQCREISSCRHGKAT